MDSIMLETHGMLVQTLGIMHNGFQSKSKAPRGLIGTFKGDMLQLRVGRD